MRISWRKVKYVNLHDQMQLFSSHFSLSANIEKRSLTILGWRWRKRAALLNNDGQLYIFKYFLEGKGAAEPYMGHIIHVDKSPFVAVKLQNDIAYIKIIDDNNTEIQFRVRGRNAYLWAAKMFTYYRWQLEAKERQPLLENISSKEPSNWSLTTAWSLSSNESYKAESSPTNAVTEDNSAEGASTISPMESTQLMSDDSLPSHVDSTSISEGTSDRKEFEIATSEVIYSSRREDSISSSYATSTISQTRTRSLSADDVNIIPLRRQRFRQQLKNLIESGIYNSLTDCTLNIAPYSATSIREINACARDLRLSSVYAVSMRDACEDGTYGINTYGAAQKQLPLCGPSMPLSITLAKKKKTTNKCID